MRFSHYLKFSVLYLAFVLCWQTQAFKADSSGFFDVEGGQPVTLAVSSFDLEVAGSGEFEPALSGAGTSSNSIVLLNNGDMDFFVDADAKYFSPPAACGGLDLDVVFNGMEIYSGGLTDFSALNLDLPAGEAKELFLTASANKDFDYASGTCEFSIDFLAGDPAGFFDREEANRKIVIEDPRAGHVLISAVYASPDLCHGREGKNEWWELFNAGSEAVDIKGWKICNKDRCRRINRHYTLEAGAKVALTHDFSTHRFYSSSSPEFLSIGGLYLNMDRLADMAWLIDQDGKTVDQVNWGASASNWKNYNQEIWELGAPALPRGHILGRVDPAIDTGQPEDWSDLGQPDCLFDCPLKEKQFNCFKDKFRFCEMEFSRWLDIILALSGKEDAGPDLPSEASQGKGKKDKEQEPKDAQNAKNSGNPGTDGPEGPINAFSVQGAGQDQDTDHGLAGKEESPGPGSGQEGQCPARETEEPEEESPVDNNGRKDEPGGTPDSGRQEGGPVEPAEPGLLENSGPKETGTDLSETPEEPPKEPALTDNAI